MRHVLMLNWFVVFHFSNSAIAHAPQIQQSAHRAMSSIVENKGLVNSVISHLACVGFAK